MSGALSSAQPSRSMLERVQVVIVNYGTPDLTIAAARSVAAGAGEVSTRIWVVDNASPDDSMVRLTAALPEATVISAGRNGGFAMGNNTALRRITLLRDAGEAAVDAQSHYVLLLNSDVIIHEGALAACVAYADANPTVGVVGPQLLLEDGSLDLACRRGFPTPMAAFWRLSGLARRFPENPRFSGYNLTHLPQEQTTDVDAVSGAFMLVRLAAIDDAGILDEDYFMYGEDIDWAWRIKAHGWRVVYFAEATALHRKGSSSRRQSQRMLREFYRAMWIFHDKHTATRTPLLLHWLIRGGILARGALALGRNALRTPDARRVA